VATLIYAVLFTDAQAPASRVPERFEQRGWYAAPQAGSGLWHVRRQALDSRARQEALGMVRSALQAHAGAALEQIDVQEEDAKGAGAGNVSSVVLRVTGKHNGRQFSTRIHL